MTTSTLKVPNISCGHCVSAIKADLSKMAGIISVDGDPAAKEITVEWASPASLEAIRDLLKEIHYPAT